MSKKIVASIVALSLSVLLLAGCTPRPETSNEIIYDGKPMHLMMTKDEVDAVLGQGVCLDISEGTLTRYNYSYTDFEIQYDEQNQDGILYVTKMKWKTDKVKTFNGFDVGNSKDKITKEIDHMSRGEQEGAWINIYYLKKEPFYNIYLLGADAEGYFDIKSCYYYYYSNNTISAIEMSALIEIGELREGTYKSE